MSENFIHRFANLLTDRYPLPKEWILRLACTTVSSVIPRNVFLKTQIGRNYCNVWNVILTESGFFKSAPFDYVIKPIFIYIDEKIGGYHILPSAASSLEGITDRATEKEVGFYGLMFQDELTAWLKEAGEKRYSPSYEHYSKMYDCWLDPRETREVKVRRPIPVYVNVIGASTPRYLFRDPKIMMEPFFQGVGNRIDYFMFLAKAKTDYKIDDLFPQEQWQEEEELDKELIPYAEELTKISQYKDQLYLDPEAEERSVEFLNKTNEMVNSIEPDSRLSFKRSYYMRDWQKSLKYAQIHAICRRYKRALEATGDMRNIMVMNEDYEFGVSVILENRQQFDKMVERWFATIPERETATEVDTRLAFQYLRVVKSYGLISQQKLAFEVGIVSRDENFYRRVSFLEETGCIERIHGETARQIANTNGAEWCEKMLIKIPIRGTPPVLYRFRRDLAPKEAEKL